MKRRFLSNRLAATLLLPATLLAAGCGDSACEGFERSTTDNAPVIEKLRLVSQLAGDPWTSIFGVAFTDSDGDLGSGSAHAEFFLNGKTAASVDLSDIFQGTAVEPSARSGELAVPLRFSETVENGASATLGVQLISSGKIYILSSAMVIKRTFSNTTGNCLSSSVFMIIISIIRPSFSFDMTKFVYSSS